MRVVLILLAVTSLAVACAAPTVEEGDLGDVGDDEDRGSTESLAVAGTPCRASKATILASVSGERRAAIARGFEWLAADVPYSQSKYHRSYRTDCSGFVSMCWELGTSYTTASFAGSSAQWRKLASYESMVPGDALVRRTSKNGHIVLFLGWNDASHQGACVLEQASTADDMQFRVRTVASLKGSAYKAIAPTNLTGSEFEDDAPVEIEEMREEAAPATSGRACVSDGACNPGSDGSGRICVGGQCVDGCRTNAQCPGVTTCVSGLCR